MRDRIGSPVPPCASIAGKEDMRRCAPTDRVDAERKRAAEEIRGRRFGPFAAAGPVRLLLVAMLVGGAGLFFAVGGLDLLSFEALGRERQALAAWVDERAVAAQLACESGREACRERVCQYG